MNTPRTPENGLGGIKPYPHPQKRHHGQPRNDSGVSREDVERYWTGKNGTRHLYPARQGDLEPSLVHLLKFLLRHSPVVEIGCGDGRIAQLFGWGDYPYIGADVNPEAIKLARQRGMHPHQFQLIPYGGTFPTMPCKFSYLFFTVLLHVRDENLADVITNCAPAQQVVVMESMDRALRITPGADGFAFQRDPGSYMQLFEAQGWKTQLWGEHSLPHFPGRIHFLKFVKP